MDDIDIFIAELTLEIKELNKTIEEIRSIIDNNKISGIEAKLMIKDIFKEKDDEECSEKKN